MKKFLSFALAFLMVLGCMSTLLTSVGAADAANLVADATPVIDGKLDELYAGSSAYTLEKDGLSVSFYLAVDSEYVYIAEVRKDATPNWAVDFKKPYSADGSLLWFNGTAVGIQWNRKLVGGTDPVLGLFFDDKQSDATQMNWETAVVDNAQGYVMEAKIPLADLKLTKQNFVDGIKFTFCSVNISAENYDAANFTGFDGVGYQLNYQGVGNAATAPTIKIEGAGTEDPYSHKLYVYQVGSNNDIPNDGGYLYEVTTSVGHNGTERFSDATGSFTYKFDINLVEDIEKITWTATVSNDLHLMASADGKEWTDINTVNIEGVQTIAFDMSAVKDAVTASKTLYIKIADNTTGDGYGGQVKVGKDITLDIAYIAMAAEDKDALEMTADEHTKPLFGCNTNFGNAGGFAVDNDDYVAGSGCLSATFKQDANTQVAQIKLDTAVDATGMDTLVFELYISDLALLDESWGGQIEISSSGTCDQAELGIEMKNLCPLLKEQGVKAGWNTVYIPLSKLSPTDGTSGAFDITNVNWFRWYRTTGELTGEYTVKIDSIRLTDTQAQNKAQFLVEYADLIAELEGMSIYATITADNYEEAYTATTYAQRKVDNLKGDAAEYIKEYTAALTAAQKAVADYEADLAEQEAAAEAKANAIAANQALYDAIKALTDDITDENYESAKAAVDAALEGWNALSAEVQGYFEEDGLKTTLDAAKAAVDAFAPTTTGGNEGCKSALTVGAGAMVLLFGAWVAMCSRKKEN